MPFESSTSSFAAEKPEVFVQRGHRIGADVQAAAFSPDSKYLATGSADLTVKLWNVATGMEIRTFVGHTEKITAIAISADGKQIISADKKGIIKLWDTVSGREMQSMTFPDKDLQLKGLRFSPEEGFFNSLASTKLTVWDAKTGKIVRQIDRVYDTAIYDAGELYLKATVGRKGGKDIFALLDFSSGKEIKKFQVEGVFRQASFSQNGKYALSMDDNYSQKKYIYSLFDIDTGQKISSWQTDRNKFIAGVFLLSDGRQAITAGKEGITLWDALQGKVLKVLTTTFTSFINLSPDGRFFLSSGEYVPTLWDTASGSVVRYFREKPLSRSTFARYNNQGKQILINRSGAPPLLWDVTSGGVGKVFAGYTAGFFAGDGRHILLIGENNERFLWDTTTDKIVKKFQSKYFVLSKDGKDLVEKTGDREFKVWETATDREIMNYREPSGVINNFNISRDNRYLLVCVDQRIKLIDIADGKESHAFPVPDAPNIISVATSRDGRYLVAMYPDNKDILVNKSILKIWDIQTKQEIATIQDARRNIDFYLSPDDETVLIGSGASTDSALLIDLATGRQLRTFKGQDILWEMVFSDDGQLMATGDADGGIILWDVFTGERKMSFATQKYGVRTLRFSPDKRQIVSTGDDGPVRIFDVAKGKEIAQFLSFPDGEWITITPAGYFNVSPNGAKHLNVSIGNQGYSIDSFYEKFFNPVYVASILQGKKVEAAADIRKGILSPPDVRITAPAPGKEFNTDQLTVTVEAKDTGGGIDEIRLYHNGKAMGEDTRAVKLVSRAAESVKEYRVLLVDGLNTFRAVGFSRDRTESNPYELVVSLAAPSQDISLHVLAVGINKYKNPALNLNYAQPDAKGITDFFRQKGKGLFKKVVIVEIYNEQATKQNISAKLKQLQNTNPQDAVLIYLAGHGESLSDKWYFIPYELTYPEKEEDVKAKGISSDELSGAIKNIRAQKILVLIDACKSGAVLIAFRGFEDRKALSQLSRSAGVHIVAASTKDQYAAEVKDLGHGVFTYILLEGLKGKATTAGKAVTVKKLMAYVEENLPEITKKYKQEAQYPVTHSSGGGMDFPLVKE